MLILFLLVCVAIFVAVGPGLDEIARSRKYKSGTGWCFWRWTDVDSEYILRLHLIKTPWCAVCLHWIKKPDAEPWLHDHPVSFLSIILRGQYAEIRERNGKNYIKVNRWFNFIRATDKDKHRIMFARKNTLTLALMGPKTREWGFTMNGTWVHWKQYYAMLANGVDVRKESIGAMVRHDGRPDSSVYQTDDGAWFWCDETWAPSGPYDTREAAVNAQAEYVVEVLGV